ncbi:hypothetical protein [Streptomyces lunaelactis]|uniref:hypothetical protein n=1 Tax=Streptomyces lunaelactis TaxID=1535768 RepID=UPI0015846287|nr:hypothetical protein [Streptomyces lunaelactis]NUK90207.1 hypothetical protein [Streptomyces lunaelactis]
MSQSRGFLAVTAGEVRRAYGDTEQLPAYGLASLPRTLPTDDGWWVVLYNGLNDIAPLLTDPEPDAVDRIVTAITHTHPEPHIADLMP